MVALFVVLTIVVCIAVDSVIQWKKAKREVASEVPKNWPSPTYAFETLRAPEGLFFDSGHTWVEVSPDGTAHIGPDGFVTSVVGRIDSVELPALGAEVRRGDSLFAISQGDRVAEFKSPVDGVVRAIDERLARHPDEMRLDPYGEGWVCSIKPRNLAANLKRLRIAEDARKWLKDEAQQFKEFFASRPLQNATIGQVLQDGGQLTGGVLELLDDETWRVFNQEFLKPDE